MDFLLRRFSDSPVNKLTNLGLNRIIPKVRFLVHQVARTSNVLGVGVGKLCFKRGRKTAVRTTGRGLGDTRYAKIVPDLRKGEFFSDFSLEPDLNVTDATSIVNFPVVATAWTINHACLFLFAG